MRRHGTRILCRLRSLLSLGRDKKKAHNSMVDDNWRHLSPVFPPLPVQAEDEEDDDFEVSNGRTRLHDHARVCTGETRFSVSSEKKRNKMLIDPFFNSLISFHNSRISLWWIGHATSSIPFPRKSHSSIIIINIIITVLIVQALITYHHHPCHHHELLLYQYVHLDHHHHPFWSIDHHLHGSKTQHQTINMMTNTWEMNPTANKN